MSSNRAFGKRTHQFTCGQTMVSLSVANTYVHASFVRRATNQKDAQLTCRICSASSGVELYKRS